MIVVKKGLCINSQGAKQRTVWSRMQPMHKTTR